MKLIIDSHNIHVTEGIEDHVRSCIEKLEHMHQGALEARIHLDRDHVGQALNKYNHFLFSINNYINERNLKLF